MAERDQPRVYRLSEKITRPDCYDVKSEDGSVVYSVTGRAISFEGKKTVDDKDGNRLFLIKEDTKTWLQKTYMHDYRTKQLYTLRKKAFLPWRGRDTLLVFRGDEKDGGVHVMNIKSNSIRSEFRISNTNGDVIATMERKAFTARRLVTGTDAYTISISATGAEAGQEEVDDAFIITLAVCIDEHYNDFNR